MNINPKLEQLREQYKLATSPIDKKLIHWRAIVIAKDYATYKGEVKKTELTPEEIFETLAF